MGHLLNIENHFTVLGCANNFRSEDCPKRMVDHELGDVLEEPKKYPSREPHLTGERSVA